MIELEDRADALRALTALLRSGTPLRAALIAWHDECEGEARNRLAGISRRLLLGQPLVSTLALLTDSFGSDAAALAVSLRAHLFFGGDICAVLDGLAHDIDARAEAADAAGSSASGARLSARLVAALPLLFTPVTVASHAPLFDATGLCLIVIGGALALAGMRWIDRLIPRVPEGDDEYAAIASLAACLVRGGLGIAPALDAIEGGAALNTRFATAGRRVSMGQRWPDALRSVGDDGLAALGSTLRRSEELGLPLASGLEVFAATRRMERLRRFEASIRKAPVLMVIPLSACALPAFLFLGVAPFLRGLTGG